MRKVLKVAGGIAAVAVVALAVLAALVKAYVTPERVKAVVLPLAEKSLHRRIDLGEIRVGLFSGIELHGLTIGDPGASEPFVAADRVHLRFQWLPLLSKRVVVDEVSLERPRIRVIRQPDGTFNVSDLLSPPEAVPAAAPEQDATAAGKASLDLLVSAARIRDGSLTLVDRQVGATIDLQAVELDAAGISREGEIPVRLAARLQGAQLSAEGVVRPRQKSGRLAVDLQGLDVPAFEPYFRGKVPGKLSRLLLDLKGEFDLQGRTVAGRGTLAARELDLFLLTLPTAPLKGGNGEAAFDFFFDPERDRLTLKALELIFNGLTAKVDGELGGFKDRPQGDLRITIPSLDLARLKTALPSGLLDRVAPLDLAGSVSAELKLNGPLERPAKMLQRGTATLSQVQATFGDVRPRIDGSLHLDGGRLQADALDVRLGDDSARLKVRVQDLFSRPLEVAADLTAPRFPIEALTGRPAAAGSGGAPATGPAGPVAPAREIGPFDLPVRAAGTVRIGEGAWRGLSVRNFVADYVLQDNRLTISRMTGDVAGGSFSNSARVDLRVAGLAYEALIALRGIEVQSLLPALAPGAAGTLTGRLDLQADLGGRGTRWVEISRNLTGDAAMNLADGKMHSSALVREFAAFLQLGPMDEIPFREFRGKARFGGGRADIDSLIVSDRIKLFPRGVLGLDGSMRVAMDTRLSPELTARLDRGGKVTRYLVDAEGWSQLPLLVSGSMRSPRYGLDPAGVQGQAGRVLQHELQRGIDRLLKKENTGRPAGQAPADGAPAPAEQAPPGPTQRLLEDSLKRVLGK